ncbi:MAG: alpha/beta hydrolase [Actinomycetia bacterium]|nr:alpha/beta hydrolase [Actinomycetes bacterium]
MVDLLVEEVSASNRDGGMQMCRRWRPGDDDPKPARSAMLIVHGIGEHSGRYDHVGRFLAERGHDVVAIDNRGHGQSSGRRGHLDSFSQFLDDVEDQVIQRRELGLPVVLFGHSLGGLISATYLVEGRPAPDLLVLSAPALGATVPGWQRLIAPILSRVAPRVFVRSDLDAALLSNDLEVQEAYRSDPLRVKGATARLGNEIFTTMASTRARLDAITIPTYVLHGSEDSLVPPEVSRPLADQSNVTYRLWPGLRHECHNEPATPEVLAELAEWLDLELDRP